MEEEVQPMNNIPPQEGMPKVYKYLIIGIVIAVILIAGLVLIKFLSIKQTSELKDYGTNFESFVSQSKSCEPSKVLYNVSLDILGMRTDTYTYEMKLKGIEEGSCLFYMEIINYTTNPPQEGLPPIEFFKSLNKTCNIPLNMVETEFEYWKSGSPQAFSNKSYCVYAEQVTMTTGGQETGNTNGQQTNNAVCNENWNCGSWGSCTNNQQIRTCTDLNNCGTTSNKPLLTQYCQTNSATCSDSDGGKDYSKYGTINIAEGLTVEDSCESDSILREIFCNSTGGVEHVDYTCPNGCSDGACLQTVRTCKVMVNNVCQEYYLPDYFGCTSKSDCTSACTNCVGGTQNCVDMGKWSGTGYDYSDYAHYYKCAECFREDSECKEGYECGFDGKCEPNFETECKTTPCPNCVSGFRKYSSSGGFSACYDCDTIADCKSGFNCTMAECVAI